MEDTIEQKENELRKRMYGPLAELMATEQAEELEAKNGLLTSKEQYIKDHAAPLEKGFDAHFKKVEQRFKKAGELLRAELLLLPENEKAIYEKDLLNGVHFINTLSTNPSALENKTSLFAANTYQELLGISDKTLLWIYSLGHRFVEQKKAEEAYAIFHMLVSFNSLVCDYWIALGFAQNLMKDEEDALRSFSMASLLNPDSPVSRYQSAKIYLKRNELDDALAEVQALETIIESQNLEQLKPSLLTIKNQILMQKSLS